MVATIITMAIAGGVASFPGQGNTLNLENIAESQAGSLIDQSLFEVSTTFSPSQSKMSMGPTGNPFNQLSTDWSSNLTYGWSLAWNSDTRQLLLQVGQNCFDRDIVEWVVPTASGPIGGLLFQAKVTDSSILVDQWAGDGVPFSQNLFADSAAERIDLLLSDFDFTDNWQLTGNINFETGSESLASAMADFSVYGLGVPAPSAGMMLMGPLIFSRRRRQPRKSKRVCQAAALAGVVLVSPAALGSECCVADFDNNDGQVGVDEILAVLEFWGPCDSSDECPGDLDANNQVDTNDLLTVLARWGDCPMPNGQGHHHDHGDYTLITEWGNFHGSNNNSHHDEMVGGRTPITTEAMLAYNNLRAFVGYPALEFEDVAYWAFSNTLTNNTQWWGNDLLGVGLWYAMQGAKVGWINDAAYDPQIIADIQRQARTICDPYVMKEVVMGMVRDYGHPGYADYLLDNGIEDHFINTVKMEPHYGGWMHGRCHGWRSIEGVAIAHDINHLPVLNWAQTLPFYNDTFDWPQWDALDVSDSGVIEYFQSIIILGDPVGNNM